MNWNILHSVIKHCHFFLVWSGLEPPLVWETTCWIIYFHFKLASNWSVVLNFLDRNDNCHSKTPQTITRVPGWIEPPPVGCSTAVTEEVRRCQCASSNAGQHRCLLLRPHITRVKEFAMVTFSALLSNDQIQPCEKALLFFVKVIIVWNVVVFWPLGLFVTQHIKIQYQVSSSSQKHKHLYKTR